MGRQTGTKHIALKANSARAWRARLGLTQNEAAEKLGVVRQVIAKYETLGAPLTAALAMAAIEAGLDLPSSCDTK